MGNFFSRRRDPFDHLYEAMIEEVYSYLPTNDLLTCTLVSKRWGEFIGQSNKCMKRIPLKFNGDRLISEDDVDVLLSSGRNYSDVSICHFEVSPQMKPIIAHFQWTTAIILDVVFRSNFDLINFLGLFEPNVKTLNLSFVRSQTEINSVKNNFIFPKLEKLLVRNSSRFIIKRMFKNCVKLKTLVLLVKWYVKEDDIELAEGIKNLMLRNPTLKTLHLALDTQIFDEVFTEDLVTNIDFHVKSLKFELFKRTFSTRNSLAFENLEVFMLGQVASIESIDMEEWMGMSFLRIIFNDMEKVRQVSIKDIHMYSWLEDLDFLEIKPNKSITYLNMYTFVKYDDIFDYILRAVPEVKTLKLFTMNQKVLDVISATNRKIENLHVDCIIANTPLVDDVFENLRNFCCYFFVSKFFKRKIEMKPLERRTRFDKQLLSFVDKRMRLALAKF